MCRSRSESFADDASAGDPRALVKTEDHPLSALECCSLESGSPVSPISPSAGSEHHGPSAASTPKGPLSVQAFGPTPSPPRKRRSKRITPSSSARRDDAKAKDESGDSGSSSSSISGGDSKDSDMERQLIELKLELAEAKASADHWRHSHATLAEENAGLRAQLGALLDLEDESHRRRSALEQEVHRLKEEAEVAAAAAAITNAVGDAPKQLEGKRQEGRGSFSSVTGMLSQLMGEGPCDSSSDEEEDGPLSAATDRGLKGILGLSGLDEDDVRYAAAHERDCLLRENDRLRSDIESVAAERDELKARLVALEEREPLSSGITVVNLSNPVSPTFADRRAQDLPSSCDKLSNKVQPCPPASLRGYLSKVSSMRGSILVPPLQQAPPLLPPESLLWDKEEACLEWSRAA